MKNLRWDRQEVITQVKADIWRHLTQAAATDDDVLLHAAAILGMSTAQVRELSQLHFVLSEPVASLLGEMPFLIRQLTTTTQPETEVSAERVRGPIRWSNTVTTRAAVGLPHLYVTTPAQRVFRTPENELLVFALDAIARFGRSTGWTGSTSRGVGSEIRDRTNEATRWRRARALLDVPTRIPSPKTIGRVRAGRRRRSYKTVLEVVDLYQRYVARLDRTAIRTAVETHALVTRLDPTLFELMVLFQVLEAIEAGGWNAASRGLLKPPRIHEARQGNRRLVLYYQHVPSALARGSIYLDVQHAHSFSGSGGLIPDLVLRIDEGHRTHWVMIEVKLYAHVAEGARAATRDLLAYRRAFESVLGGQAAPYGLGVAWGAGLAPTKPSEIQLSSHEALPEVLTEILASSPSGHGRSRPSPEPGSDLCAV